jgi:hypothetical protein
MFMYISLFTWFHTNSVGLMLQQYGGNFATKWPTTLAWLLNVHYVMRQDLLLPGVHLSSNFHGIKHVSHLSNCLLPPHFIEGWSSLVLQCGALSITVIIPNSNLGRIFLNHFWIFSQSCVRGSLQFFVRRLNFYDPQSRRRNICEERVFVNLHQWVFSVR